jgi:hypothetical protein
MKRILIVVAIVASTGCSYLLMPKPAKPYSPQSGEPTCTTKRRFAISDTVLVVIDAMMVAYAVALDTEDGELAERQMILLSAGIVDGLARTLSARSGYRWLRECAQAKKARADYLAEEERRKAAEERAAKPFPPKPNGFFCGTQFCSRGKPLCDQTKTTTNDAAECTFTESAHCFALKSGGHSCWKTDDECQRQHAASDNAVGEKKTDAGECAASN